MVNIQQRKLGRTARTVALTGLLAVGATACGKSIGDRIGEGVAERVVEQACEDQGEDCNIDIDGGNVAIETDDGSVNINVDEDGNVVMQGPDGSIVAAGSSAELPDNFPADVPLPDDYTVASSISGGDAFSVTLNVGGEVDAVADSLQSQFEAGGWTTSMDQAAGGRTMTFTKGESNLLLMVDSDPDGNLLVSYIVG